MQTIRQSIVALLSESECSARDISQALRIAENEVYTHLSHIARSLASKNGRLQITPAHCLQCGYTFGDRKRFTKPSRCPRCKGEHIEEPKYRVQA